jgi:hypothetical protein
MALPAGCGNLFPPGKDGYAAASVFATMDDTRCGATAAGHGMSEAGWNERAWASAVAALLAPGAAALPSAWGDNQQAGFAGLAALAVKCVAS